VFRPQTVRRPENVAWLITAPLAALAVILVVPVVANHNHRPIFSPLPVTLLFLGLFLIVEATEINLEVRRHALRITLGEIPLVLALFYLSPLTLLAVRIVALALVQTRNRIVPVKFAFNLANIVAGNAAALLIAYSFRPLHDTAPSTWLVVFAAVGANVLSTVAAVIGVMMSRSWTVNVFQAFTPTWYRQQGYGPEFYGPLATTLVLASAIGTVGCGSLADRFGRRTVILATLVLSIPAILLFTMYPGPWAFGSAILIGVLAASTAPLMLLMAQQLMAARAGLASGLVMGLGFVTGAIGVPINGAIADAVGLQKSLMTHVILVIITIGIAWFLPREREMERYAETRQEPLRAAGEQV